MVRCSQILPLAATGQGCVFPPQSHCPGAEWREWEARPGSLSKERGHNTINFASFDSLFSSLMGSDALSRRSICGEAVAGSMW